MKRSAAFNSPNDMKNENEALAAYYRLRYDDDAAAKKTPFRFVRIVANRVAARSKDATQSISRYAAELGCGGIERMSADRFDGITVETGDLAYDEAQDALVWSAKDGGSDVDTTLFVGWRIIRAEIFVNQELTAYTEAFLINSSILSPSDNIASQDAADNIAATKSDLVKRKETVAAIEAREKAKKEREEKEKAAAAKKPEKFSAQYEIDYTLDNSVRGRSFELGDLLQITATREAAAAIDEIVKTLDAHEIREIVANDIKGVDIETGEFQLSRKSQSWVWKPLNRNCNHCTTIHIGKRYAYASFYFPYFDGEVGGKIEPFLIDGSPLSIDEEKARLSSEEMIIRLEQQQSDMQEREKKHYEKLLSYFQ